MLTLNQLLGVNLQNDMSTEGSLFLHLDPLCVKFLNNCINFKIPRYESFILQNVEG